MSCKPIYTQERDIERIKEGIERVFDKIDEEVFSTVKLVEMNMTLGNKEAIITISDLNDASTSVDAYKIKIEYETKPFNVTVIQPHKQAIILHETSNSVVDLIKNLESALRSFSPVIVTTRQVQINYKGSKADDWFVYQSEKRLD